MVKDPVTPPPVTPSLFTERRRNRPAAVVKIGDRSELVVMNVSEGVFNMATMFDRGDDVKSTAHEGGWAARINDKASALRIARLMLEIARRLDE